MEKEIKNKNHVLDLTINEKKHEWHQQYITGEEIRKLGGIPKEDHIFLTVKGWEDEHIHEHTRTDLARPGIEHFYSKKKDNHPKIYKFSIDGKPQESKEQFINNEEIRRRGNIPNDYSIYLKVKGAGDDILIENDEKVDLAQPGKEEFYGCKPNTNNG